MGGSILGGTSGDSKTIGSMGKNFWVTGFLFDHLAACYWSNALVHLTWGGVRAQRGFIGW